MKLISGNLKKQKLLGLFYGLKTLGLTRYKKPWDLLTRNPAFRISKQNYFFIQSKIPSNYPKFDLNNQKKGCA